MMPLSTDKALLAQGPEGSTPLDSTPRCGSAPLEVGPVLFSCVTR
jgi:hypothetical protein